MTYDLLDFAGNIGALMLMIAYFLLQLNKLKSESLAYSLLNALGAGLIALSLLGKFNLSAFLIEIFWILISFLGIYRYFRLKTVHT